MSLVISPLYVIAPAVSGGGTINGDNPVIGYDNLATASAISTDTAAVGFPASNLGNPATHLRWVGEVSSPAADEHITVVTATGDNRDVDYIAVARHNFGSARIPVSAEYLDQEANPPAWVELIASVLLPDDGPALFRFPPLPYAAIRLRLQPGDAAPTAAVVYAGKLLVLQRRLYVGHTPMPYGRQTKVINARSEAGHFLGRIVLNQVTTTEVKLQNLTPAWYRAFMEPFIRSAVENPFFFAWRPQSYPSEVGFGWLTSDPKPVNARPNGMMSVDLEMSGVV
jgi:hypothetical protein